MPYNHRELEHRLKKCREDLNSLLEEHSNTQLVKAKIKSVDAYYNLSYAKASKASTVEQIVRDYEALVKNLAQVKNGNLKPELVLNQISSATNSRKRDVVFHDLAKVCESIFWAATAFSLYAAIWGIALPVLVVQPVLGVAVAVTVVGAMLKAAHNSLSCLSEMRSFGRHSAENDDEARLVSSFFKPKEKTHREEHVLEDELDPAHLSYS
jgi:hypothetical protein